MFRHIALFLLILQPAALFAAGHADFNGAWELVPPKSSVISLYGKLFVDFEIQGDQVTVVQQWGTRPRDSYNDTVSLKTDGKAYPMALQHQVAPTHIFLGVANKPGSQRRSEPHGERPARSPGPPQPIPGANLSRLYLLGSGQSDADDGSPVRETTDFDLPTQSAHVDPSPPQPEPQPPLVGLGGVAQFKDNILDS